MYVNTGMANPCITSQFCADAFDTVLVLDMPLKAPVCLSFDLEIVLACDLTCEIHAYCGRL